MASKTTNIGLTKPSEDEFYDIDVFNDNADIIDAALNSAKSDATNALNKVNAAVPNSRKVNDKALSSDIMLSASDIGLKTENWTFTLEDGQTVTKAVYVE